MRSLENYEAFCRVKLMLKDPRLVPSVLSCISEEASNGPGLTFTSQLALACAFNKLRHLGTRNLCQIIGTRQLKLSIAPFISLTMLRMGPSMRIRPPWRLMRMMSWTRSLENLVLRITKINWFAVPNSSR